MNLSISNIIWRKGPGEFPAFLAALRENGINAVELSINSIFAEPADITEREILWLKQILGDNAIKVSALHTLTYTRPDLLLFGDSNLRNLFYDYILMYRDFARELKCDNIVLGSPAARKRHGLNKVECNEIFLEFLSRCDGEFDGIHFNIEPLPGPQCEYLETFREVYDLIKSCKFRNIKIQIDIRSSIDTNESLDYIFGSEDHKFYIKHVQVSDPGLRIPSDMYGKWHHQLVEELVKCNYSGYVSAEVIPASNIDSGRHLSKCAESLRRLYGNNAIIS